MSTPILATKLYIPTPQPTVIQRKRLMKMLHQGLHCRLTLIAAPAGFGKTTLVTAWAAQAKRPFAWLSLDEGDSDLARFLAYLVAALQTIDPRLGTSVDRTQQPLAIESLLTTLLNEMAAVPTPFILVLDDYHRVQSSQIDQALAFLLDYLPPQLHVVITTREDPNLPLARWRARGQMHEVRAADLRFTVEETAVFLNEAMGLNLTSANIDALGNRTEGWIAGLQMAALALRRVVVEQDPLAVARFIQAFGGSHRYVLDYLLEEVLQRQETAVRTFLMKTAVLERLHGSLCNAVTEQSNSATLLKQLEKENLFLVPLDEQRQWYRYHHLFADMLQARLAEAQPEAVFILHQRASRWFETRSYFPEAIHHALAAQDFVQAAKLIETHWETSYTNRQEATLQRWVQALPNDLVRASPVLDIGYIWVLLLMGDFDEAGIRIADAEKRAVAAHGTAEEEVASSLRAQLANARLFYAQAVGNLDDTLKMGQEALAQIPEAEHYTRGITEALLGVAYFSKGELEAAEQAMLKGMESLKQAGNLTTALHGVIALVDIKLAQGRLREAIQICEDALVLSEAQGEPISGTADFHLLLSDLRRMQGNEVATEHHYQQALGLSEQTALPDWPANLALAQARRQQTQGALDESLALLAKAERLQGVAQSAYPILQPISALKARIWIAQGQFDKVRQWIDEVGITAEDNLTFVRQFEHITLARFFLAHHRQHQSPDMLQSTMPLLTRLLQAAEAGNRGGSQIEILLLQAMAYAAQGMADQAVDALMKAIVRAEPEGYMSLFVEEDRPLLALLPAVAQRSGVTDTLAHYVRRLQAKLEKANRPAAVPQPLPEPLSEREFEVLKLLDSNLSGPQIAQALTISLNTMRTHTKNIYSKLGVNNRRTAVRRAKELSLL